MEWGDLKWDVDKAAQSLDKDLFGKKKKKSSAVAPDSNLGPKNGHSIQDSDDEQFSKKGKKKLKEKKRKINKSAGETVSSNDVINTANESNDGKQIKENSKSDIESSQQKSKKKKRKNHEGTSEQIPELLVSKGEDKSQNEKGQNPLNKKAKKSAKEATDSVKTDVKQRKRKRLNSDVNEEVGAVSKKRKISVNGTKEGDGEEQEHKKKRRNRKKKNNSKKNKYKHLALNSKKEKDTDFNNLNNLTEEIIKDNSSVNKKTDDATGQEKKNSHAESAKLSQKKMKKKTNKTSDSQTNSLNLSAAPKEVNEGGKMKVKKKKDNKMTPHQGLDKQRLQKMLNVSALKSDPSSSQIESSSIDTSPSKKKKRKKGKQKSDADEEAAGDAQSRPGGHDKSSLHISPEKKQAKESPLPTAAKQLKDKATEKLVAGRFRFINEQLYTCKGSEAQQLFRQDQEAFKVYHQGFQSQTAKWPLNPLDVVIKHIMKRPKQLVVADFGCGDAKLSQSVEQKVHSFDLVALNKRVTACDMSKTPLPDESIDIAVFCLSLMGTNLNEYILEANRVLKPGGLLKIAEVVSRFHNLEQFIKQVSSLGFQLLNKRELQDMFYLIDFKKSKRIKKSPSNAEIKLKPCVYKKR